MEGVGPRGEARTPIDENILQGLVLLPGLFLHPKTHLVINEVVQLVARPHDLCDFVAVVNGFLQNFLNRLHVSLEQETAILILLVGVHKQHDHP